MPVTAARNIVTAAEDMVELSEMTAGCGTAAPMM
jgi:hypothetical protein